MRPIRRLETVRDLRRCWTFILDAMRRDLGAASRLQQDPKGTLLALGFDVGPEAEFALMAALP